MIEVHKYASNTNINTHGKTKIQYKNTDTHKYYYWQSEPDQKRKKMRFSEEKGLCMKMVLTSFLEYFPKVPGWQNEPIP